MKKFSAFVDRKSRDSKHNLRLLKDILSRSGFQVKDHTDHHGDPYIYVEKPVETDPLIETLPFGGIRIYTKGTDLINFRPQNSHEVEPYGPAYLLDVKGMFKDLIKEGSKEKIGLDLIKYIVEEVLNFFIYSAKAQNDQEKDLSDESDMVGKVIGPETTGDVSGDLRRNNTN